MNILKKENAPRYIREKGIKSYLLASSISCDSVYLTSTLVEIDPGGMQRIHNHYPEQIYFIIEGSGKMTVRDETQSIVEGDCIFIPSNEPHGLINDSDSKLIYFSAAAPSFTKGELLSFWPLHSEEESK